MQNVYEGWFTNENWYQVTLNGERFGHARSLMYANHSPDGFAWGYHGSGPAQLALAILLVEVGREAAMFLYMDFKDEVIARLKNGENARWTMDSEWIGKWVQKRANEIGAATGGSDG